LQSEKVCEGQGNVSYARVRRRRKKKKKKKKKKIERRNVTAIKRRKEKYLRTYQR
jgi:hypothetical protein